MEEYSYTSTHPLGHTGPVTGSLYLHVIARLFLIFLKANSQQLIQVTCFSVQTFKTYKLFEFILTQLTIPYGRNVGTI